MKNKNRKHSNNFFPVWKKVFLGLAIILSGVMASCGDDDRIKQPQPLVPPTPPPTQTLLMYMPWSTNLTSYFKINIADMEEAVAEGILEHERVVVFLATSPTKASMFELTYDAANGACVRQTLKEYENHPCTTAEGIAAILSDMKTFAPADIYSMTIGGHGLGWLPVQKATTASAKASAPSSSAPTYHWEVPGEHLTRYFGGTTANHQTDIVTLAEAIESVGIVMEYILFDDCYMSNVEVAYDLRHVTRHLIASTCEVMAYGMPYHPMAKHLLGEINYDSIGQTFHRFYMDYSMPCGTIATTVTSELDSLATLMREINTRHTWSPLMNDSLQHLDGYSPHLFYDLADYTSRLCTDTLLSARFTQQLERAVPATSRTHTPTFYSMYTGREMPINTFCGLTISDPSTHRLATPKSETNWYKATH
ncbi:MAG: Clostripain family protein [Bacteroidaceae bacterium]|nr:Clostripain family protein [Bacteroidaceae bacterium]